MLSKADIRIKMKIEKSKLSLEEIEHKSNCITNYLIQMKEYEQSQVIYSYLSFNQEVQTHSFIEYSLLQGKKVAVPKIVQGDMNFYYINDLKALKPGGLGILEPDTNDLATDRYALIIMPGLAFDKSLNRIGYGRGYYDRYLEKHKNYNYVKFAFAYDFQVLDHIQVNLEDIKVDQIITPKRRITESGEINL